MPMEFQQFRIMYIGINEILQVIGMESSKTRLVPVVLSDCLLQLSRTTGKSSILEAECVFKTLNIQTML